MMYNYPTVPGFLADLPRFAEEGCDEVGLAGMAYALAYEVCDGCDGSGTTTFGWHRSEAAAFTADDLDEMGYEGREELASGAYDRACPTCEGLRVIQVFDADCTNPALIAAFRENVASIAEANAIHAAEARMGA
jgi:hypothetical protein